MAAIAARTRFSDTGRGVPRACANSDTRSSFYTWVRQMVGCYMLYPGFIIASVFSDLIVVNYVQQRPWSVVLMVIFSFILKLTMLATVKATVNKWL